MLHDTQRTSAPRSTSVSMSTAVWMVMCSDPMTRAPASGCLPRYSARIDMRPGISCSASWISLRPHSASERSATLKAGRSVALLTRVGAVAVAIVGKGLGNRFGEQGSNSGGSRRTSEQRWAPGVGIGRQWRESNGVEAGRDEPLLHALAREAEPGVAHRRAILVAVVREHVDDEQAAPLAQRASRLREREHRIRKVVQHEAEERRVRFRIRKRQRLELALPQLCG